MPVDPVHWLSRPAPGAGIVGATTTPAATTLYAGPLRPSKYEAKRQELEKCPGSAAQFRALAKTAQRYRLFHDGVIVRIKFEATDASGKVHKRISTSHVYSHCLVLHFAAHPPSNLQPKGIAACSHAEWAESRVLAERNANRWRKQPHVDTIEILDAIQV